MIVFDDTRLIVMGSQTKIVFNAFMELRSEAIAKDPTGMETALSVASEGMMGNLRNLKRIVESR